MFRLKDKRHRQHVVLVVLVSSVEISVVVPVLCKYILCKLILCAGPTGLLYCTYLLITGVNEQSSPFAISVLGGEVIPV